LKKEEMGMEIDVETEDEVTDIPTKEIEGV
jgi:hypothetical protein